MWPGTDNLFLGQLAVVDGVSSDQLLANGSDLLFFENDFHLILEMRIPVDSSILFFKQLQFNT